ncbi:TlpA family protein disulfide reductase [Marinoscillum luteum]|uniref:TlpA family protein disulfide reductase n=1 Tax=Marinoscillum luteum TaxID=861051 RepID=A0ABW7N8D8_9BACT
MKKILILFCTLFIGAASAQEIRTIKLPELEQLINTNTGSLKVFNFWASWCGPCVKELGYFNALGTQGDTQVILVSLDFPEDIEKARRILEKKEVGLSTYLLDEKDYDKYITSIDNSWSGAIPATLFIDKKGNRYFYESSFEKQELDNVVNKLTSK